MLHTACKPRFREHRGTLNQSRVSPGARGGSVAASPGVGALLRDAQPAPSALVSAAAALSLQVAAPDLGTAAQRQEEGHGARAGGARGFSPGGCGCRGHSGAGLDFPSRIQPASLAAAERGNPCPSGPTALPGAGARSADRAGQGREVSESGQSGQ